MHPQSGRRRRQGAGQQQTRRRGQSLPKGEASHVQRADVEGMVERKGWHGASAPASHHNTMPTNASRKPCRKTISRMFLWLPQCHWNPDLVPALGHTYAYHAINANGPSHAVPVPRKRTDQATESRREGVSLTISPSSAPS